jgi:alpha-tubulin suppressor-like RCC1 family protein
LRSSGRLPTGFAASHHPVTTAEATVDRGLQVDGRGVDVPVGHANRAVTGQCADRLPGLRDVTAVAVGEEHGCALLLGGAVECWGENEHGELGIGTSTGPAMCNSIACSTAPVAVTGL